MVASKKVVSKTGAKATGKSAARKSPPVPAADDHATTARDFHEVVNMSAHAIGEWLKTKESHVVGAKDGVTGTAEDGPESVGHRSGRRIIALLGKESAALTASDYAHMRKVIGYVHRHLAQKPAVEDVKTSRWRYSLMNWGHDPLV